MVDFRAFLGSGTHEVLPWFGGPRLHARDRVLSVKVPPLMPGWYRWAISGRTATCEGPSDAPDVTHVPRVTGVYAQGRLYLDGRQSAPLALMPAEHPPLFAPVEARRWYSGDLIFETTAFARTVHDGMRLFTEGFYDEAKPYFEQVLNANGSFILSYQAIADAYFKDGNYAEALTAYRYAEDQRGYSQAFWELRNEVLQRTLTQALGWIFGLWLVSLVATPLDRRYHWSAPITTWFNGLRRIRLIDDFVFMFRFVRHPSDSFYYIKTGERGSLLFAFLIYAAIIVIRVVTLYVTGFSFAPYVTLSRIPLETEVLTTLGLFLLWIIVGSVCLLHQHAENMNEPSRERVWCFLRLSE